MCGFQNCRCEYKCTLYEEELSSVHTPHDVGSDVRGWLCVLCDMYI